MLAPACSPSWLRRGGDRVRAQSITNERVPSDAKFKAQRPTPGHRIRPLDASDTSRNICGRSRGGPGLCTCERLVESQLGRRLCENIAKFRSPDWPKRGEIFVSPLLLHPPSPALNSLPSHPSSVRVKVSYLDNHPQAESIFLSAARFPSPSSHFIFC